MAFVKKTWKDRIVQYANRRLLTKSGGEVEQVTVTRDEGTISEAGDQFNASNMNNLEQRVKNAFDDVDTALSGKAETSDIPTRSDFIRYEDKTIGAVEFTNAYYLLPSGSRPTVPSGYMFLMGVMLDYGSIQSGTSAVITIEQNGTYLFGIAGSKYSNVKVRYIYIKS